MRGPFPAAVSLIHSLVLLILVLLGFQHLFTPDCLSLIFVLKIIQIVIEYILIQTVKKYME